MGERGTNRQNKRPRAKTSKDLEAQAKRIISQGLEYLQEQLDVYTGVKGNGPVPMGNDEQVLTILKGLKDLGFKHVPVEQEPSGARVRFLEQLGNLEG